MIGPQIAVNEAGYSIVDLRLAKRFGEQSIVRNSVHERRSVRRTAGGGVIGPIRNVEFDEGAGIQ